MQKNKVLSAACCRDTLVRSVFAVLMLAMMARLAIVPAMADANEPLPVAAVPSQPVVITDWTPPPAFLAGMAALAQGDADSVNNAIAALKNNPLAIYLRYCFLLDAPNPDPDAVIRFLQNHPGYLFSEKLKAQTLNALIAQGRFGAFQALYSVPPTLKPTRRLSCQRWQATLAEGALSPQQIADALKLWVRGRSQPAYCDPAFKWLQSNNRLTSKLYRQRIKAAMIAGNPSFAAYLVRAGKAQHIKGLEAYFKRWQAARNNPERLLQDALNQKHALRTDERERLIQAFKWLGRQDPSAAHELLARVPKSWSFQPNEVADIARGIALKAAYTRMPQAYAWLVALPQSVQDKETLTWAARAAMRAQDWQRLKDAIDAMPVDLSQTPQWQYWLARADAELGQNGEAKARWMALMRQPNYYGLLSADRLGVAYPWPKTPPLPEINTREVEENPTVQLAFYLHAAGLIDDARKAFLAALKEIPPQQIPAMTILAEQASWPDRVSIAIARMHKQDDPMWFAARFPTPWRSIVDTQAKAQGIASNWLYGVIRRESLFMSDVGSGAGAQGLMQLMPSTARWINKKADLGLTAMDLHDPKTSITLGAAYLAYLKNKFDDQIPLAVAAYNAGPGRVRQWLPTSRNLPGDVWVDTILFDETRNYVRAVLAATMIYSWREADQQPQTPDKLLSLLTPVQATNPVASASIKSSLPTVIADRSAGGQ